MAQGEAKKCQTITVQLISEKNVNLKIDYEHVNYITLLYNN